MKSHNIDKFKITRYNSALMRKLIFGLATFSFLAFPGQSLAQEATTVCVQSYGGGVVCGVHTPVATGAANNILLIGLLLLASSIIFYLFSRKAKRNQFNQNR
jgi:hypothetical protein